MIKNIVYSSWFPENYFPGCFEMTDINDPNLTMSMIYPEILRPIDIVDNGFENEININTDMASDKSDCAPENGKTQLVFTGLSKASGKQKTASIPGTKRSAVKFEFELDETADPVKIVARSNELEKIQDLLEINIYADRIALSVDSSDYRGSGELALSQPVHPQFTVGYFEENCLKLWLKKQEPAEGQNRTSAPGMIWCSENLMAELEDAKTAVSENQKRYHKVQLDYQNLIVSSKREKDDFANKFASELLLKVLDVQDNFDRALEAAKKTRGKKSLVTGIEMIRKQLMDVLISEGVTEIKAEGEPLNTQLHEVCSIEENPDIPDNTVIEVLQKGYVYKDKVLRLAKVNVAKSK